VLESRRKSSVYSSPQPEARRSIDFVDPVLGRKFHDDGALGFSARSKSKAGSGLGLTALLDEEDEGTGERRGGLLRLGAHNGRKS